MPLLFGDGARARRKVIMVLLSLAIPIGATLGIATWALMRGRGGFVGVLLCAFFAMIGAILGALAADALAAPASRATAAIGAVVGAVVVSLVEGFGFGPRPKRVAWADPKGVAVTQPDDGSVPKSLV
jgi:hypothetical protein